MGSKKLDRDKIAKGLGAKRRGGKVPRPKGVPPSGGATKTARDEAEMILVLVTPQAVALQEWGYVDLVATKGRHVTAAYKGVLKDDPYWSGLSEFLPDEAQEKFLKPGFHVWECIPCKNEWHEPFWTFEDGYWRKPLAEDNWPAVFRLPGVG